MPRGPFTPRTDDSLSETGTSVSSTFLRRDPPPSPTLSSVFYRAASTAASLRLPREDPVLRPPQEEPRRDRGTDLRESLARLAKQYALLETRAKRRLHILASLLPRNAGIEDSGAISSEEDNWQHRWDIFLGANKSVLVGGGGVYGFPKAVASESDLFSVHYVLRGPGPRDPCAPWGTRKIRGQGLLQMRSAFTADPNAEARLKRYCLTRQQTGLAANWREEHRDQLRKAVRESKGRRGRETSAGFLQKRSHACSENSGFPSWLQVQDEQSEALATRLGLLSIPIPSVELPLSPSGVEDVIRREPIDSLWIAKNCFNGAFSSEEVENFWWNYAHPSFTTSRWTTSDEYDLVASVYSSGRLDWKQVIARMNKCRTFAEMFWHYVRLQMVFMARPWTPEDDCVLTMKVQRALKRIVGTPTEKRSLAEKINWEQIATSLSHRTQRSIILRYRTIHEDRQFLSRPFSRTENRALLLLQRDFGDRFDLISKFFRGTRSPAQLRKRWHQLTATRSQKTESSMPSFVLKSEFLSSSDSKRTSTVSKAPKTSSASLLKAPRKVVDQPSSSMLKALKKVGGQPSKHWNLSEERVMGKLLRSFTPWPKATLGPRSDEAHRLSVLRMVASAWRMPRVSPEDVEKYFRTSQGKHAVLPSQTWQMEACQVLYAGTPQPPAHAPSPLPLAPPSWHSLAAFRGLLQVKTRLRFLISNTFKGDTMTHRPVSVYIKRPSASPAPDASSRVTSPRMAPVRTYQRKKKQKEPSSVEETGNRPPSEAPREKGSQENPKDQALALEDDPDKRLTDLFISAFFWPALMANQGHPSCKFPRSLGRNDPLNFYCRDSFLHRVRAHSTRSRRPQKVFAEKKEENEDEMNDFEMAVSPSLEQRIPDKGKQETMPESATDSVSPGQSPKARQRPIAGRGPAASASVSGQGPTASVSGQGPTASVSSWPVVHGSRRVLARKRTIPDGDLSTVSRTPKRKRHVKS